MASDFGPGLNGLLHGVIGRAVVNHQNLEIRIKGLDGGDGPAYRLFFVVGRKKDRHQRLPVGCCHFFSPFSELLKGLSLKWAQFTQPGPIFSLG